MPPSDKTGSLVDAYYNSDDYVSKYSTAIYYSMRLFTVRDISPTALIERTMFGIFAVLCAMVNANIFGNMYVLVSELNASSD